MPINTGFQTIKSLFNSILKIVKLDGNTNNIEAIKLIIGLLWSTASMFLVCELSERLTIRCESFEDDFCRWHWYLFPIEMQKLLSIAIANSQQTMTIKGYANIPCTRFTFKSVIAEKLILKYFEMHLIIFVFNSMLNLGFYFAFLLGGEDMPFLFYGTSTIGCIRENTSNETIIYEYSILCITILYVCNENVCK